MRAAMGKIQTSRQNLHLVLNEVVTKAAARIISDWSEKTRELDASIQQSEITGERPHACGSGPIHGGTAEIAEIDQINSQRAPLYP